MMKASYALSLMIHWMRSILHNWDALIGFLKSGKKSSKDDVENIKYLKNYLNLTQDSLKEAVAHSINDADIKELKAMSSPPK